MAAGDPDRAVAAALSGLPDDAQLAGVDVLLPLAARALAEQVATCGIVKITALAQKRWSR